MGASLDFFLGSVEPVVGIRSRKRSPAKHLFGLDRAGQSPGQAWTSRDLPAPRSI